MTGPDNRLDYLEEMTLWLNIPRWILTGYHVQQQAMNDHDGRSHCCSKHIGRMRDKRLKYSADGSCAAVTPGLVAADV